MGELTKKLSKEFRKGIRAAGEQLFWHGRVDIVDGTRYALQATVTGRDGGEVDLQYNGLELGVYCECRYFATTGPCQHIWATLLAADSDDRYLSIGGTPVVLVERDLDDDDFDEFMDDFELSPPRRLTARKQPSWRKQLEDLEAQPSTVPQAAWPPARETLFVVDVSGSQNDGRLTIELLFRDPKKDGGWGKPRHYRVPRTQIGSLPDENDRQILAALAGGEDTSGSRYYYYDEWNRSLPSRIHVESPLAEILMPRMCGTGRCWLRPMEGSEEMLPLAWNSGEPWRFSLNLEQLEGQWLLDGALERDGERMGVAEPVLVTRTGLLFTKEYACLADIGEHQSWFVHMRRMGRMEVPEGEQWDLLAELAVRPDAPPVKAPEEMRFEEVRIEGRPHVRVSRRDRDYHRNQRLAVDLSFDYDGEIVPARDNRKGLILPERRLLVRDRAAELAAMARLLELGVREVRETWSERDATHDIAPTKLPRLVRQLVEDGWHVEAEGKLVKRPSSFHIEVSSGIDWFELHGDIEYGDTVAKLPELLKALDRGDKMVRLGDGTYGMLPEEWLRRLGPLTGMGTAKDDHLRFQPNQVGLLDAMLAERQEVNFDEGFHQARHELQRFDGVHPLDPPAGFTGKLRDYQRDGLGWMAFLRGFGFGGCLADDMGVGKTIQVLALLEGRREEKVKHPSLVVVPRSLVFNWMQEAARFTPKLRVTDYSGPARNLDQLNDCDVAITTYGTLRSDIVSLRDIQFDYVVLDEAQMIKNDRTKASKATRLLRAGHRLALSGTPIENHLGELWSLFEFLNPGMLGASSVFKLLGGAKRAPEEETRRMLASALRPFILRRTKQLVASELPEKIEQTLVCEMQPSQRRLYDELKEYYRDTLLKRIDSQGIARSKIQVLEALLRLRQAACHPGLIDDKHSKSASAKFDMMLPQLEEVLDEGHKALVFSQFTSFLSILRERLGERKIAFEYLDGQTRDRQARVERFQQDPNCKLFLISLKAGGLGLNLTAADYIFLLDPWWNPAVERQAIDRAHRIGQTRKVPASRLICRDTAEAKVIELQERKREPA
ncbi:MAG: DEAD/DEAH box helicase family protein, partial [bacterium]|nr:DEAD/DEAH box helicase family protein [bacterium]